jgi:hypothetical protein
MVIENRLLKNEVQQSAPLGPDAYEVYWRSTADDCSASSNNDRSASSDSWDCSSTGNAYSELWQLWDGQ